MLPFNSQFKTPEANKYNNPQNSNYNSYGRLTGDGIANFNKIINENTDEKKEETSKNESEKKDSDPVKNSNTSTNKEASTSSTNKTQTTNQSTTASTTKPVQQTTQSSGQPSHKRLKKVLHGAILWFTPSTLTLKSVVHSSTTMRMPQYWDKIL